MTRRIRTHTNPLTICQRLHHVAHRIPFESYSAVNLDIGFGKGQFIKQYATQHPDELMIGVEVRQQMVRRFESQSVPHNCVPIWGSGMICLADVIPDQSLHRLFIFHPDPWFKKRHHKRRVLTREFLQLARSKMAPGGRVYISTDVYCLYNDMMNTLQLEDNKEYIANDPFWHTEYLTHWSQFSTQTVRSQFFATFQFNSRGDND